MRLILFLMLLLFTACGNYNENKNQNNDVPPMSQGADKPVVTNEIGFSTVKTTVFEASCVKCHQNYSFYDSVKQDLDSIVQTIETDRMPKNGPALTSEQKKLLNDWVKGGAMNIVETKPDVKPDDKPTSPPLDDKLAANWSSLSRKIFFARCTTCHNPNGDAKFLDLSSRQKIFESRNRKFGTKTLLDFENADNSYMLEVIQDPEEPMPPKSSKFAQLTKDEVSVLKEWISLGLP